MLSDRFFDALIKTLFSLCFIGVVVCLLALLVLHPFLIIPYIAVSYLFYYFYKREG